MDWPQMLDTFARMPAAEQQAWWRMAAGLLAVVVALLWLESRYFKPSRRVGSWLAVRLVSVLAALLAVAAVLLPARAVGGPAALGVFVLTLYTLGPVVWFGGHVLAGRWVRPALSRAESLVLGLTGLAIAAVPIYASLLAQSALQTAARDVAQRRELPASNPPLAHTVQPVQRYHLPGVGLIYTQSLLGTTDNRLLRVEQRHGGGQWPTHPHPVAHPSYCTHGNDVHLMWSAQEPPPYLRLHWAQSNGAPTKAEFTPQLVFDPATPVPDFPLTLRPDGADPAAPIARERAYLVLVKEGQAAQPQQAQTQQPPQTYTQMLGSPPEAGEVRTTDCVMAGFQITPTVAKQGWQVHAMGLVFQLSTGGPPLRALVERK